MLLNETEEYGDQKLVTSFKRETEIVMGFIFLAFSILGKSIFDTFKPSLFGFVLVLGKQNKATPRVNFKQQKHSSSSVIK